MLDNSVINTEILAQINYIDCWLWYFEDLEILDYLFIC